MIVISIPFRILLVLCAALPAFAQGLVNDLRVESHDTYEENIFGFRQDIIIEGTVNGDVGGVGCNIHINGKVTGNISALGGMVVIQKNAEIGGSLVCLGGQLVRPENVQIEKVIHEFDPTAVSDSGLVSSFYSRSAFYLAQTLCLFLLVIFTFYIFPSQIHEASFQLSQDLVRPLIVGVFSLAAFFFALVASFLLMVVGIGFLMFLIFFAGFLVVALFGMVVIFYRLSQVMEQTTGGKIAMVGGVLLATMLVGLLMHVPVLGSVLLTVFMIFGTGVVIETRFGTNKQWFTRRSRYW